MSVTELPAGNATILLLAALLCIVYYGLGYYAFSLDEEELNKCKVMFFQENISTSNFVYSISMTIKEKVKRVGVTDLILRLRGTVKDGPLILYRDDKGNLFRSGTMINIGLALPFTVGPLLEIDIACTNDRSEENVPVLHISDVYVRQYPRWSLTKSRSKMNTYTFWKQRATSGIFSSLASDMKTWVCVDTITNTAGAGIVGLSGYRRGKKQVLRARDVAIPLPLTKEDPHLRRLAKMSFRSLHYLYSLSSGWHDAWSNFSRLDHVMVLLLDQLGGILFVCASYAYGFDLSLGMPSIAKSIKESVENSALKQTNGSVSVYKIEQFDLYKLFGDRSQQTLLLNAVCIVHVIWMGFLCSMVIIPFSLALCRLFRMVGGKGFEKIFGKARNVDWGDMRESKKKSLNVSAGPESTRKSTDRESTRKSTGRQSTRRSTRKLKPQPTSLMLRTLECRSVHAGACITSDRRLRVEPMICNCLPDHVTARSVAYVRTKMTRLRDEEVSDVPSGMTGVKSPDPLHESHTESTDAPIIPQPTTAPDGKGEVVRVARYCERLVQQATEHLLDNSVIAECFELAPNESGSKSEVVCCPRKCCQRDQRCVRESKSASSFFNDHDAASVKDMVSNFSLAKPDRGSNFSFMEGTGQHQQAFRESVASSVRSSRSSRGKKSSIHAKRPRRSSGVTVKFGDIPIPSGLPVPQSYSKDYKKENNSYKVVNEEHSSSPRASFSNDNTPAVLTDEYETKSGTLCIGRRGSSRSVSNVDLENVQKRKTSDHVSADAKKKKHHSKHSSAAGTTTHEKTPFPSGILSKPKETKAKVPDEEAQFPSIDQGKTETETSLNQMRKLRNKLVAFVVITFFQLGVIALITLYKDETQNRFFPPKDPVSNVPPDTGRMHGAFAASIICLIFYFVLVVHLIALFSVVIDRITTSREEDNQNMYYDDVTLTAL